MTSELCNFEVQNNSYAIQKLSGIFHKKMNKG